MLSACITFLIFLLIGVELRDGLKHPKEMILPGICALVGMITPALIFIGLQPHSRAWAVSMPTDVALAIGALSFVGKRVNPAVRLFLLTLAVADDLFSLIVIGIFFRSDLHLSSAIYTFGAALLGFVLPKREILIKLLAPIVTFLAIPIYLWIILLSKIDLSVATSQISLTVAIARIIGKALGLFVAAWALTRFTRLRLPTGLTLREIFGVGLLAGMGLTVSLVIAGITLSAPSDIAQVRTGLLIAAVISGISGSLWLRNLKDGAPRQD